MNLRRLKVRTLEQIAFDIAAENSEAEGLEEWLRERPGVSVIVGADAADRWKCVVRRDDAIAALAECHPDMRSAIIHACRAYESTRPASEYDQTWTSAGWKKPVATPRRGPSG